MGAYMFCLLSLYIEILILPNPAGPLSNKRTDVLPQARDVQKREIRTFSIALKFYRRLGSNTAEMHIKFQSDTIIITDPWRHMASLDRTEMMW